MITGGKEKLLAFMILSFAFGPGAADAQRPPAGSGAINGYTSVNGWDLRITRPDTQSNAATVCTLSSTMLGDPSAGARGGRATARFENKKNGMLATIVITGGVDPWMPIEIWVDGHLIADKNSATGAISFSPKTSANVATLFKAGRGGAIRFHRNGHIREVLLSLNGFTKAVRAFRSQCSMKIG